MKLTPHIVAETIRNTGADSRVWMETTALPPILKLLDQAVLFDFGTLHPSPEHKDFALDLYERKLFTLPFPVTAFAFQAIPNTTMPAAQRLAGGLEIVSMQSDGALTAIMCTEQRTPDGRSVGAIPIGAIMHAKLSNPKNGSVTVDEETYPLISRSIMRQMYGDDGPDGLEIMRNRLCSNLVACMGMAVMLMSKGIEAVRVPAPDKLNKARERKGKGPIRERFDVRIIAGDVRSIATDDGDEDIAGHVRGSPRMHWRRGHFRTLYRGTEHERVQPIAPMLVGANETAEQIRKSYKVRS